MAKTLFERHGGSAKIETPGLETKWASFRGFSLLFDNPDLAPGVNMSKNQVLESEVDKDPSLTLYRELRDTLHDIDMDWLVNEASFCPLPPSTYHITAWDGLNDGNADQVQAEYRDDLLNFLARLPDSLREGEPFLDPVCASPLLNMVDLSISFRFGQLVNWENMVIICKPDIIDDVEVYDRIVGERKKLSSIYRERFGISMDQGWFPHITLGYFADQQAGSKTMPYIDTWSDRFQERLEGLTITYKQVGLYGFTDMATFIRYP